MPRANGAYIVEINETIEGHCCVVMPIQMEKFYRIENSKDNKYALSGSRQVLAPADVIRELKKIGTISPASSLYSKDAVSEAFLKVIGECDL